MFIQITTLVAKDKTKIIRYKAGISRDEKVIKEIENEVGQVQDVLLTYNEAQKDIYNILSSAQYEIKLTRTI